MFAVLALQRHYYRLAIVYSTDFPNKKQSSNIGDISVANWLLQANGKWNRTLKIHSRNRKQ